MTAEEREESQEMGKRKKVVAGTYSSEGKRKEGGFWFAKKRAKLSQKRAV